MPKATSSSKTTKASVTPARGAKARRSQGSGPSSSVRIASSRPRKGIEPPDQDNSLIAKSACWEALQLAAECLRVLAHPHRLRMIQMLLVGRFTVGELALDCELANNVASEHLRLMQRCGFLESQRESKNVYYRVREPHLASIMRCIETRFIRADS